VAALYERRGASFSDPAVIDRRYNRRCSHGLPRGRGQQTSTQFQAPTAGQLSRRDILALPLRLREVFAKAFANFRPEIKAGVWINQNLAEPFLDDFAGSSPRGSGSSLLDPLQ
jgi:hypothetical protein